MSEVPADIKDLASLRSEYAQLVEQLRERLMPNNSVLLLNMMVETTAIVDLLLKAGMFTDLEYTQAMIDSTNRIAQKFGDRKIYDYEVE